MKRTDLLVGSIVVGGLAASAHGVVGVNDPCPLPTPFPPPGAGWAALNNPGFEGGFTNGVANQWIGWKDATYTGQVHFAGTDRFYAGTASQKLVLSQPPPDTTDQEAGLYQQVYVVPGGTYTVTAKFYLYFPVQTYNGEDLLAFLGVDPFGQASGDGYGMVWAEVSSQNQWRTATVAVDAVMPVMTIGVKGTRKWPMHGDGAQVWIDALTITGPVPTDPPPGAEPDPVDPETLIPETTGSNLVSNASFEETFTNGVSAGWNKWWTSGTGTWKRSQRVGKVGGGRYDCCCTDSLAQMNAKTILLYGDRPSPTNPNDPGGNGVYGDIVYLTNTYPHLEDAIFVGRPAIDDNWSTYRTNPVFYGRQLANQLWIKQQQLPRFDCWQGVNEPDWGETWQTVLQFEKAFADRAHELGMKVCSLNLSTGSPGNIWRMIDEAYDPSCSDLLAVADYLGHHCYGGPSDDLMLVNQNQDDACSFSMRPRRFKDMYDRRGWRFPPVIATEGSTWGGSTDYWGDTVMSNDLTTMGAHMNANRWWCGYTNFVVGGSCGWGGFEIGDHPAIISAVGTFNADHPADAMDGVYSQMFGAGKVHPKTLGEMTPAGLLNGGVNRQVTGLTAGQSYLALCWMKYEFRGHQPTQLKFYLGIDPTGQTANGNAGTIDWGDDQIAGKAPIHEIFTHVWRTFTATGGTASVWLRAHHPANDPSVMFYADQVEVKPLASPPDPFIDVSPPEIAVSATGGVNPPNGSFNIRNAGAGTITYALQEACSWLSVVPAGGTSTGETDTIALVYDVSGLGPGTHECQITVTAPEATNSPLAAPHVTLTHTFPTVDPDFDLDGDVDQADFGHFQNCLTGSGVPPASGCQDADLQGDQDVDQSDFAIFQACLSGSGVAPDLNCAD